MSTLDEIVIQLYRTMPNNLKSNPGRFRIAVTEDEYNEIKQYALARDGHFFGRLLNYPLVIDNTDDPELPEIPVIYK